MDRQGFGLGGSLEEKLCAGYAHEIFYSLETGISYFNFILLPDII
jgi:hypothetical protein